MTKDLCKSCINTGCEFQSGIARTKCAFYIPPISDADLDIDEEIKKFESNAEFERTHENLRGCQEFKKFAGWLKELKELKAEQKNRIARERYEDLVGYFGGDETIIESREEFQKWLARIRWHVKKCDELAREKEAEPCEDAISREEMLKYQWYLHGKMSNEENHKLWQFIKSLPSVTQKQKTGKWNILGYDDPSVRFYKCSECHMKITLKFNYCQNCGAKMEVKNDT